MSVPARRPFNGRALVAAAGSWAFKEHAYMRSPEPLGGSRPYLQSSAPLGAAPAHSSLGLSRNDSTMHVALARTPLHRQRCPGAKRGPVRSERSRECMLPST